VAPQSLSNAALPKAPSLLKHRSPGIRAIALPMQAYMTLKRGRSGRRLMIAACRHGPAQFTSDTGDLSAAPRQQFQHRSALVLAS
jgi:hypothetical protein